MKAIVISDLHFGMNRERFFNKYKEKDFPNQKEIVENIVLFCKKNAVNILIICGDLFDSVSPSKKDLDYFDSVFQSLNKFNINVLLISGNHDSFIKGSFWETHIFPKNVFFLEDKEYVGGYETFGINFVGRGFREKPSLAGIKKIKNIKNVLIYHGGINGDEVLANYPIKLESSENNLDLDELKNLDFDLILVGHYHIFFELDYAGNKKIINCGSVMGKPFKNTLGTTGLIITFKKNNITVDVEKEWN